MSDSRFENLPPDQLNLLFRNKDDFDSAVLCLSFLGVIGSHRFVLAIGCCHQ